MIEITKDMDIMKTYHTICLEMQSIKKAYSIIHNKVCKYEPRYENRKETDGFKKIQEREKKVRDDLFSKEFDYYTFLNIVPILIHNEPGFGLSNKKMSIIKNIIIDVHVNSRTFKTDAEKDKFRDGLYILTDQLYNDYELYNIFMDCYEEKARSPTSFNGNTADIFESAVFSLFFWLEHLYNDTHGSGGEHYYIRGTRYMPAGEGHDRTPCGGYLKTADGKYDGTKDIQCWCQGKIPKTLSESYMKDNGEFIRK